ncbi:MAG: ATP-binding protein [Deltaproteobacteria bacterium]|jgi:signal transduction histidine kinase
MGKKTHQNKGESPHLSEHRPTIIPPNNEGGARELTDLGYKAIIDLLPCYLTIQDRSFHILQTNQTFRNDFGDAIGKKCYEAYKKGSKRCSSCPVAKTFVDKKVHIGEETVHLADGAVVQMIVYAAPVLDAFGNVAAVIELSTNISKVKEMQKELAFLGQSIATLSHDIKNILEGLQGGAYVVDEGLKDGDQELVNRGWGIVKKNIAEVSGLVRNILYSSKKRRPACELVAPEALAREVVGLLHEKAKSLNIELKEMYNPRLPMIELDPVSSRRMLNNLIWNAFEACENDREKAVHTVSVRADFYDENHFFFEVEDDGIGMDESTREKLFTDFYSTKGTAGTGLGLLVVHKIVTEHGGKVEVFTRPGKGSMFRVLLSMRQPKNNE